MSTSANINHVFANPINVQGPQRWAPTPGLSNEYMQGYGFPKSQAHGLPNFSTKQAVGPSFGFGSAIGGVPNVDGSSSSSCRVNGSSPNTVFGSFSSSIGPTDMTSCCTWLDRLVPELTTTGRELGALHNNSSMSAPSLRMKSSIRSRLVTATGLGILKDVVCFL